MLLPQVKQQIAYLNQLVEVLIALANPNHDQKGKFARGRGVRGGGGNSSGWAPGRKIDATAASKSKAWAKSLSGKEKEAVHSWVSATGGMRKMRRAVENGTPEGVAMVAALKKAPIYKGDIYRGMYFSSPRDSKTGREKKIDRAKAQDNFVNMVKNGGLSNSSLLSFSRHKKVAMDFAALPHAVMLVVRNGKGRSIEGAANKGFFSEGEVLSLPGAKYRYSHQVKSGNLVTIYLEGK